MHLTRYALLGHLPPAFLAFSCLRETNARDVQLSDVNLALDVATNHSCNSSMLNVCRNVEAIETAAKAAAELSCKGQKDAEGIEQHE